MWHNNELRQYHKLAFTKYLKHLPQNNVKINTAKFYRSWQVLPPFYWGRSNNLLFFYSPKMQLASTTKIMKKKQNKTEHTTPSAYTPQNPHTLSFQFIYSWKSIFSSV